MYILDKIAELFSKKQREETLEELLAQAYENPSKRPSFYRKLLETDLYFFAETEGVEDGGKVNKDGEKEEVATEGSSIKFVSRENEQGEVMFYVFSKLDYLNEFIRITKSNIGTYLKMNAKTLFEIIYKKSNFNPDLVILNPATDLYKPFSQVEIRELLDGGVPSVLESEKVVIEEDQKILVGEPADYPIELVNGLKKYFEEEIKSVYSSSLVLVHKGGEEKPNLVLQIEMEEGCEDDFEKILPNIQAVIEDGLRKTQYNFIDFMPIKKGGSGIADAVKPFFVKGGISK